MSHLLCNTGFFSIEHYIMAMLGVNTDGSTRFRMIQVDTIGNYLDCGGKKDTIDTPEALFRALVDKDHCDNDTLRVDIQTNDSCARYRDCKNSGFDAFTDLRQSIGMGDDGGPVLRIMLSNDAS